jgi:hypothetical protein
MKGIDCRTLSRMFGNIHDWLICRITALLYYAAANQPIMNIAEHSAKCTAINPLHQVSRPGPEREEFYNVAIVYLDALFSL